VSSFISLVVLQARAQAKPQAMQRLAHRPTGRLSMDAID
jgi:hypothetical protein